ncbi:MAG TPA: ABC transporter permease [Bacteroidota bacterium]|jgi:ABC-type lipoprotein release transport system permease subunit|nr:ABC transporter permease [Bacteroidota bacterium]
MKIPLSYSWRSLWTRRLTTILTLAGITLVAFVFAAILMMAHGVEVAMVDSGSDDNIIAIRKSATSELTSQVDRESANILKTHGEIAHGADGKPLVTSDVLVVINLFKKVSHDLSNVSVRGLSPEATQLRPQVKLSSGRMFQFGTHEVIVGKSVSQRFDGCEIGGTIRFMASEWLIVGVFDADGTSFESEIWSDVEQLMPAVGRPIFNSVTMRLTDPNQLDALKESVQKDPRTQSVDLKREKAFYAEQSKNLAGFIRILGTIVTVIFSIGAIVGAVITMYAAVSNRTVEIGTLRSLGFQRRSILSAFLIESTLLAVIGGLAGIALASLMSFVRISTVNFGTFSELAFGFELSGQVIISTLIFAVVMGFLGGFLPAVRAARLSIVNALRSS